jgi:hypothetical protein
MRRLFEQQRGLQSAADEPTAREHALGRAQYVRAGGGTPPPGATPIDAVDDVKPSPQKRE